MNDVFVSYKSEDRARLTPLVAALEAEGFDVWWDAHIGTGADWREEIQQRLDAALCAIGDANRARDWIDRAMLMDPENNSMRYNLACALSIHLHDFETALEMLEPYFAQISMTQLRHIDVDPDLKELREVARFQEMHSAAEARLKAAGKPHSGLAATSSS